MKSPAGLPEPTEAERTAASKILGVKIAVSRLVNSAFAFAGDACYIPLAGNDVVSTIPDSAPKLGNRETSPRFCFYFNFPFGLASFRHLLPQAGELPYVPAVKHAPAVCNWKVQGVPASGIDFRVRISGV